jgi:hypothetical protein
MPSAPPFTVPVAVTETRPPLAFCPTALDALMPAPDDAVAVTSAFATIVTAL